jgi:hypothetical protein
VDFSTNPNTALAAVADRMAAVRTIPRDLKAPVDLLCLIRKLEDACEAEGKLLATDRHHMEYGDDQAQGLREEVDAEVERLQGNEFTLLEVVHELLAKCEVSDDCQYGTLSTAFVRDVLRAALAECGIKEQA